MATVGHTIQFVSKKNVKRNNDTSINKAETIITSCIEFSAANITEAIVKAREQEVLFRKEYSMESAQIKALLVAPDGSKLTYHPIHELKD